MKQVASEDGKNFKELHIHIMNIKDGSEEFITIAVKTVCKIILMNTILDTTEGQIWIQYSMC